MPPKGEATSARMAEAMLTSIQSRGFAGTGLSTVLDEAAAPRGSMYFHFPEGKEQLGERAIELAATEFEAIVADAAAAQARPSAALASVLDVLTALLRDSDYRLGCPVTVVTLEMGAHSERLRTACAAAYERWISPFAAYLEAAGADGTVARATAETVVASVEGAIVLSRSRRDTQPLASVGRTLGPLLDGVVA